MDPNREMCQVCQNRLHGLQHRTVQDQGAALGSLQTMQKTLPSDLGIEEGDRDSQPAESEETEDELRSIVQHQSHDHSAMETLPLSPFRDSDEVDDTEEEGEMSTMRAGVDGSSSSWEHLCTSTFNSAKVHSCPSKIRAVLSGEVSTLS